MLNHSWPFSWDNSFKKPRVDIRKLKQLERQRLRQLETQIEAEQSLVERVRLKLQLKEEVANEVNFYSIILYYVITLIKENY